MKASTGFILVAALLAATAQPFDCKEFRSRDHLDYMIRDDATRASILAALTDIDVTDEMSAEEIGERIVAASAHTHQFRHIYLSLAELTKTGHTDCSPETVALCLSIMSQSHLQAFWKFVEASRDRFHRCAQDDEVKILNHIKGNPKMRRIVKSLERFIRIAMGVPDELEGLDYLAELKKFDMTRNKLKSRLLISAIDKSKLHFNSKRAQFLPVVRIEQFLDDRCMPFRFVLRNWFDSINLDLLLGNKEINAEIDRVSEYHRICVDWVLRRPRIIKNLWKGFWTM